MYLNFELLYNINEFLFPLFYYKLGDSFKVYSPMTLRHITIYYSGGYLKSAFFDLKYGKDISDILYYFTLEQARFGYSRTTPIDLDEEELSFLCSNQKVVKWRIIKKIPKKI